jgi:molybdenum cofactor cytidylyltransferase
MTAEVAERKPLAAVILSGGESRRMGSPKALISYRGKTFVEHLLEVTRHPRVGVTRIVVGAHAEEIRAKIKMKISAHAGDIVVNVDWENGQLSSIQAAIRSLTVNETSGLILCPVDHPVVSAALVAQLIERFDFGGKSIVLPTHHGKRGHPLLFRSSLYDELLAASAEVGARQVVWAHADDVDEVDTGEEGVVLNINDPETLERVLGSAGQR